MEYTRYLPLDATAVAYSLACWLASGFHRSLSSCPGTEDESGVSRMIYFRLRFTFFAARDTESSTCFR